MQEAYLYGLGRPADQEQSYLWSQLAAHAYRLYLETSIDDIDQFRRMKENTLHAYSTELLEQASKHLTQEQKEYLQQAAERTEPDMNWDYAAWVKTRNYVPLKP
jgi:DNA-binding SARP family transcriptional activator